MNIKAINSIGMKQMLKWIGFVIISPYTDPKCHPYLMAIMRQSKLVIDKNPSCAKYFDYE